MYLYEVGYGSYEDSEYDVLYHTIKYSDNDLKNIVIKAIITVLEDVAAGLHNDVYIGDSGPSYDDIHSHVINELISNYGFERVSYQAKWSCFGWPSLVQKGSWESQRGDELREIDGVISDKLRGEFKVLIREYEISRGRVPRGSH